MNDIFHTNQSRAQGPFGRVWISWGQGGEGVIRRKAIRITWEEMLSGSVVLNPGYP